VNQKNIYYIDFGVMLLSFHVLRVVSIVKYPAPGDHESSLEKAQRQRIRIYKSCFKIKIR
jgi:hypothetical protein